MEEEFEPRPTPDGRELETSRAAGEPLMVQVIRPTVKDGIVRGVLIVRCGETLISEDVVNLTSAARRTQLIKRLVASGITDLSEKALLALDHVCRLTSTPPPPPPENVQGGEVKQCGHFIAEEKPEFAAQQALEFFAPLRGAK